MQVLFTVCENPSNNIHGDEDDEHDDDDDDNHK